MSWPAAMLAGDQALVLALLAALPAAGGLLAAAFGARPNLRETVSVITGLVTAAGVLSLWPHAHDGLRLLLWDWLPGLPLAFALEPLGLLFASLAACLWPVTTIYAIGYMRGAGEGHQTRFYLFFALAISAALAIAFSGNGLTLFLGYELLTLSTYPLVAHKGTPEARRGARVYLGVLLATSIGLLLPALVWTYQLAGTLEFRAGGVLADRAGGPVLAVLYALFLLGIGKAALMPVHRWLPSAMVAPTPVSALLHAVAVVKAGVFCVLKVTIYLFGLDLLAVSGAGEALSWLAAFTLLAASVVALRQDNLKSRLAYSTVSQLAYIVLGASLAGSLAALGGALHMVTHALGKITLFFCAGAIYVAAHRTRVSELDGLGRAMPLTFAAFTVASLSIIGLPPLAGMWSKLLLMQGAQQAGAPVMIGVLLVSSLLAIGYLLPIPARAFLSAPRAGQQAHGEAPWACVLPLCLTALGCVLMFLWADRVIEPLGAVVAAEAGRP